MDDTVQLQPHEQLQLAEHKQEQPYASILIRSKIRFFPKFFISKSLIKNKLIDKHAIENNSRAKFRINNNPIY